MSRVIARRLVGSVERGRGSNGSGLARTRPRDLVDLPIDFLFIDGDHAYEAVQRDWEDWSRHVTPAGTSAFHDAMTEAAWMDDSYGSARFVPSCSSAGRGAWWTTSTPSRCSAAPREILLSIHHPLDPDLGAPGVTLALGNAYQGLGHDGPLPLLRGSAGPVARPGQGSPVPWFAAPRLRRRRRGRGRDRRLDRATPGSGALARARPQADAVARRRARTAWSTATGRRRWRSRHAEPRAMLSAAALSRGGLRLREVARSLRSADSDLRERRGARLRGREAAAWPRNGRRVSRRPAARLSRAAARACRLAAERHRIRGQLG